MAAFPSREWRAGETDLYFKVILLGDAGTGKTSLMRKYVQSASGETRHTENSTDMSSKILVRDDQSIQLDIRDTAGMERYRSLTKSHYNGAAGALVLFDLTDVKTFHNVQHWLEDLRQYSEHPDMVQVVLVGTRSHLKDQRVVSPEKIAKLAEHHDAGVIEVSIRDELNVTEAFELIVERIMDSHPEFSRDGDQPLLLAMGATNKDVDIHCSSCCHLGGKSKETGGVG